MGEPIALIMGETVDAAVAGAELVVARIDPLTPVVGIEAAVAASAFLAELENNIAYRQTWEAGGYDDAVARAHAVVGHRGRVQGGVLGARVDRRQQDAAAACGQLRNENQKVPLEV